MSLFAYPVADTAHGLDELDELDEVVPGEDLTVTGSVSKVTQARIGRVGDAGAATFTLQLVDATGEVLATEEVVAEPDGSFATTVPASLLAEVDASAPFDVVEAYAEPLPVLVIAELLGVPRSHVHDLREWSQAIVRMYEPAPDEAVVAAAVGAAEDFAALVRDLLAVRRRQPAADLITDLAATELSDDEVVAAVVLLLNAGHEASVNVFGNGLVAMLRRGLRPGSDVAACVEEMLRFDSALQLFERTATEQVELPGGIVVQPGEKVSALLGAANRDPAVFERPDEFDVARAPNPHLAFGVGVHFCLGAPLARMELTESVALLFERLPDLALAGEPESRGTFVLRGHRRVEVAAAGGHREERDA